MSGKQIDVAWIQKHLDQPVRTKYGTSIKQGSPRLSLDSGGFISVQASAHHYCSPKRDTGPYSSVEIYPIGLNPASSKFLNKVGHTSDDVVWGWLGVKDVVKVINLNGGVK